MHKKAVNVQKRNQMGALPYFQTVVQNSQIGQGIRKMCDKDRDLLCIKLNTVYYIAKHEKAFMDYPNLLELQEKNNIKGIDKNNITDHAVGVFTDIIGNSIENYMKTELKLLRFYSISSDGSTDSENIEEEFMSHI